VNTPDILMVSSAGWRTWDYANLWRTGAASRGDRPLRLGYERAADDLALPSVTSIESRRTVDDERNDADGLDS